MKVLVLFAALVFASLAVAEEPDDEMETQFPQQHSANDLLQLCASSALTHSGRERRRYCAGFVSGVEESIRLLRRTAGLHRSICPPPRVSARHLADIYVQYASKRKRDLNKPAAEVAFQALIDAYPCPPRPR